ncbi:class I SAM-dependent methyltransferase [Halovivax cerinus]|uniref:Class I SAM-dependent methyltransferase n=1 Tax=Halovivax cerinus TaxID=1487865 RepID=A0ABD5NTP2_9EURY|nr:class I SAM-dependent methyltransferase [Halovivax cerinus]
MTDSEPSVAEHYDELASDWERFVDSPWKRDLLWPIVSALLPDVEGHRVLDVGCGDGAYAARLADAGADVVGVDLSEEMVRVARERYGDRATFERGDVTSGLPFVADGEVDVLLCQHVLSHVPDLDPVYAEFARVLGAGGTVVLSTHHPLSDYLVVRDREYPEIGSVDGAPADPVVDPDAAAPDYHDTERFRIGWGGDGSENPGTYFRRPLGTLVGDLIDAGFDLDEFVEPNPAEHLPQDALAECPDLAERPPRSICLRADRR